MENLILKRVTHTDVEFLYELLKQRKNYENISHTKIPTFKQHVKFINSIPYSKWYVILCDSEKIGSIYLSKQNEIGIHIKNNFDNLESCLEFKKNCEKSRDAIVTELAKFKSEGKQICGYAATSKSTTILNYCNLDKNIINFIGCNFF